MAGFGPGISGVGFYQLPNNHCPKVVKIVYARKRQAAIVKSDRFVHSTTATSTASVVSKLVDLSKLIFAFKGVESNLLKPVCVCHYLLLRSFCCCYCSPVSQWQ